MNDWRDDGHERARGLRDGPPVWLITGCSSGFGRAVADAAIARGDTVVATARDIAALDDLEHSDADRLLRLRLDLVDQRSIAAATAAALARFGRLDVLFNNAGINAPGVPLEQLTVQQWRSVVDTNLTGAFLCTQQAFALMKDQTPRGGRIINNGSISAYAPRPNSVAYTATKHAVTGLTKSTSLDGRKYDIACGQIDIGNAATEMTTRMAQGIVQANGEVMIEPRLDLDHVVNAVIYMAGLPLDANVQFMTIMATKMPFIGRG
jgi:NAD(P)-dependent dehydrogenase (short-subunit alcohol dehydrogenase family)